MLGKIRILLNTYNLQHVDPDEVLQEGIILLDELVRGGKFRGESSTRSFLISICKNLMRNDVKKVKRVVLRDTFDEADFDADPSSADAHIMVHEKTDVEEKRDGILRALMGQVTEGCQEVLNLFYYKAFSMAQIADERGLSGANQAKKAAYRCREQLRDLIKANPILANFLKESL